MLKLVIFVVLFASQWLCILSFRPQKSYSRRCLQGRNALMEMKVHIDAVTIHVESLQPVTSFYDGKMPLISSGSAEAVYSFGEQGKLTFVQEGTRTVDIGQGFAGLTFARANAEILAAESANEHNVVREYKTHQFGASMLPDEDEMKYIDVNYGWFKDPNGFRIELRQDSATYDRIVLNVLDFNDTIDFFSSILGFSLLRKRSNVNNRPREASFSAYMGNNSEKDPFSIELVYHYSTSRIKLGNSLQEIVLRTDNLQQVEDAAKAKNVPVVLSTDGSIILTDPNGYKIRVKSN